MSEPFIGELKCVAFNFPPKGWTLANGQLLPINQNQALFSLFGTTYGGDGRQTFGLPDLRGRIALHRGEGITQGEKAGEYFHTVIMGEMPAHTHFLSAINANANNNAPNGNYLANTTGNLTIYGPASSLVAMAPSIVPNIGGSQPHENRSPYLVMNWIVALQGIFPSQT